MSWARILVNKVACQMHSSSYVLFRFMYYVGDHGTLMYLLCQFKPNPETLMFVLWVKFAKA